MKTIIAKKFRGFNFNLIKKNSVFIIFSLFLIVGIISGVILFKNNEDIRLKASELFSSHYKIHSGKNFFAIAGQTLLNILPLVLISFVVGTSAAGCVLIVVSPLLTGFLFGIISAFLYNSHEIMGIVFNLLILLPATLVAFFGILLCCRESFGFSKLLASMCVNGGRCFNLYNDFKNYSFRYIVILIVFILYAFIDAAFASIFIKFFNF